MMNRFTSTFLFVALASGCPAEEDAAPSDAGTDVELEASNARPARAVKASGGSGGAVADDADAPSAGARSVAGAPAARKGGAGSANAGRSAAHSGSGAQAGAGGGAQGADDAGAVVGAAGAAALPMTSADAAPTASDEIDSVAFEQAQNGNPTPLILFKGGYACRDKNIVEQDPIDAAAHRAANPDKWLQWRRGAAGVVEIKGNSGAWSAVDYDYEYEPLDPGTPLSGLHEWFFTPDPNAETLVLLVWRYRFHSDGTFEYCYTSTIAGDPSIPVFSKMREQRKGKYRVEGYTIHLDDDAGVSDVQSFFFDGSVSSAIYIDSQYMYAEDDEGQALCD